LDWAPTEHGEAYGKKQVVDTHAGSAMSKKLTITLDDEVYEGLCLVVGRKRIGCFLNDLARPHVTPLGIAAGYRVMTADETREREAAEWAENLTGDIAMESG
jgi:hypothetical protein